jgi:hypothetical protein
MSGLRMVELYLHSSMRPHGVAIKQAQVYLYLLFLSFLLRK